MCGLYSSIGFTPDRSRIEIVAHRGPDGEGWQEFVSGAGPVALGHRRLAIIDLSDDALQPMRDESGRFHLVFNGEIYNYKELRRELESEGHRFRTDSDSEVLLKAYMFWGRGALDRFLGMFAFVIWDDQEKIMFAARDRFGIKPLYIASNNYGVAFASEIKQLLNLQGMPVGMNLARVRDFLLSGISDHTSETLFSNIKQLRGGEYAEIRIGNSGSYDISIGRWYEIPDNSVLSISSNEAAEQFESLLRDSVRLHLRSDVPVGSCLSGGLDSSSLVCLMAEQFKTNGNQRKIQTISACFDEKSVDERPYIESVIEHTNSEPNYVFPRPDDVFDKASEITWHQDEPFGSTSIFAQWCVFEEAKRAGITVMLDGQGADEPLAGYHSSFHYYMKELVNKGRWGQLLRTMTARKSVHGTKYHQQINGLPLAPTFAKIYGQLFQTTKNLPVRNWLDSTSMRTLAPPVSVFDFAVEQADLEPVTDLATFCRAMTFGVNLQTLLHYEDRNSMAHSIEARVPFLDHRLVEFVLSLGSEHKIVGAETKYVMRRAMTGILPEYVRKRQDKLGFATPEEIWFRGSLRDAVKQGVEETLSYYPDLLDAAETRLLVDDYLDGKKPFDFTLWRIANMGLWGKKFGVSM